MKFPHRYRLKRTNTRVKYAIAFNWTLSFVLWVPLILYYAFTEGAEGDAIRMKKCDLGSAKDIIATMIGSIMAYVIPIFIMIFFAIHSVHLLLNMNNFTKAPPVQPRVSHTKDNRMDSPITSSMASTVSNSYSMVCSNQKFKEGEISAHDDETEIKIMKDNANVPLGVSGKSTAVAITTLTVAGENTKKFKLKKKQLSEFQWIATFNTILTISFVVNVFPFGVLAMIRSFCETCITPSWWHFGYIMGYLNSILNPICYAVGNKNFKKAFRLMLLHKNEINDNSFTQASSGPG